MTINRLLYASNIKPSGQLTKDMDLTIQRVPVRPVLFSLSVSRKRMRDGKDQEATLAAKSRPCTMFSCHGDRRWPNANAATCTWHPTSTVLHQLSVRSYMNPLEPYGTENGGSFRRD